MRATTWDSWYDDRMRSSVVLVCLAISLSSAPVLAQQSGAQPYYQPQGGYPQYQQPSPQQYRLPDRMPYKEGKPIPIGYHVEDVPNKGLVTAGWITTTIPYAIGLFAAVSADFKNESGWLAAPVVGPWLMLGKRDYGCEDEHGDASQSLDCVADVFVVMGLITDGIIQAAGGSMLLAGYVATKPMLVRDEEAVRVAPMQVGTGYGVGALGRF